MVLGTPANWLRSDSPCHSQESLDCPIDVGTALNPANTRELGDCGEEKSSPDDPVENPKEFTIRIVYVAVIGESRTIWMMDVHGGNARQLTAAGYADVNPSVTADGRRLVFQSNRGGRTDIWRMDLDGGNARQLTQGGGNSEPHVSPDGRSVVYVSSREGRRGLWRVSIEGAEAMRLTDTPASWPRISLDSTRV